MKNQPLIKILLSGLLALLVFVMVMTVIQNRGVSIPQANITLRPLGTWTDDIALKGDDLPQGWRGGGLSWYDLNGTQSRLFWFENPAARSQLSVVLSEIFAVYSTTLFAQQSYPGVLDVLFPPAYADEWKTIDELKIPHHADELKTACLQDSMNDNPFLSCRTIARYQNVIVVINGNVFEDKWLTRAGFRALLEAADRRITDVLSHSISSPATSVQ